MENQILYRNRTPLKILFALQLFFGGALLIVFILLYLDQIYLDIYTLAGPLLGLALIISGVSASKIKEILYEAEEENITITKEALFKSKNIEIPMEDFNVQLKSPTGTKKRLFPLLRLIILNDQQETVEMKSGFMCYNNSRIRKLFKELKDIATRENNV